MEIDFDTCGKVVGVEILSVSKRANASARATRAKTDHRFGARS